MQTRANIKRLTKTFVTLSLADVASRIGLASTDQAERHIVAMVQEGSIHARISQKDGKNFFVLMFYIGFCDHGYSGESGFSDR